MNSDLDLAKSHIKGHMRDGHYVKPYERKGGAPSVAVAHPKLGEKGEVVMVKEPHHGSSPSTWHEPDAVATFVPEGNVPGELNGIPFRRWRDAPTTTEGWDYSDCINDDIDEPAFHVLPGKSVGAGVVIEEKDGRVWVIHPTNAFGGYKATWPKGTAEKELSLQGNAAKEAYEESGLKIRITGFIGDYERTTSKARMYTAVRVSGDPTDCGWETQGVSLVPRSQLYEFLNGFADHPIAEAVGAGPAPKKPEKPAAKWQGTKKLF